MLVCDKENIIELDGMGNVLEIDTVRGIGSGGLFAECKEKSRMHLSYLMKILRFNFARHSFNQ
jgi:ATP-dependent protease HslVU (ClpYQ) peptidase subunit